MSNNGKQVSLDQVVSGIDQKLAGISSQTSSNDYYQSIFRIDKTLRETYPAAYEPEMVSIGPYHRGENNLQKMEKYKLEYLQGILNRQNETSVGRYIASLLEGEEKARRHYAEDLSLNREKFVEMMLLDGCFIVEFLRKYAMGNDEEDPIFKMKWIVEIIRRDLLLFENQIPFFILVKLFDMTKISNDPTPANDLISLAFSCLNGAIDDKSSSYSSPTQPQNAFHLLDLMYENWCFPFAKSIDNEENKVTPLDQNRNNCPLEFSCINFGRKNPEGKDEEVDEEEKGTPLVQNRKNPDDEDEEDLDDIVFIKSVTELNQDGIKFIKLKESKSWLDIKFENGEIKIPPLVIQDSTESIIRNLIAYEQYMFDIGYSDKFITDYATFMDCLINTPMDVQKLRVKGIIKNRLGSDEEVTDMFNNICKNVFLSPPDFAYREHFKNVNKHCKERKNKWIHDFNETHFKNPWSIISLIAAIFLLIFTFIQTVMSFLQ